MRRYFLIFTLFAVAALAANNDWANWRGPDGGGLARGDAPLTWSDAENVEWTADIPGRGTSSPVIWGDRIFLTTAIPTGSASAQPIDRIPGGVLAQRGGGARGRGGPAPGGRGGPGGGSAQAEHRFVVMCLDKNSGDVLWEKTAIVATPHEGYHPDYGSFASSTPTVDAEGVYVFFGSRGAYVYDHDGNLKWGKDFGIQMRMFGEFGEGAGPTVYGDTMLLKFDHTGDGVLIAVNKNTGEELWRQPRGSLETWSAPLVVEHDGRLQAIAAASDNVRSYDLETGELIWECSGLGGNQIPMPVAAGDIVYVMSGYQRPNLLAIRLGGSGDITGSDLVLWTQNRGLSYVSSPALVDGRLYVIDQNGILSNFNALTGERIYQERLPGANAFKSSPVAANGKLYLANESGQTHVVRLGDTFEVLATNTLADQTFIASPAIADGEIYLRSRTTLFAIQ